MEEVEAAMITQEEAEAGGMTGEQEEEEEGTVDGTKGTVAVAAQEGTVGAVMGPTVEAATVEAATVGMTTEMGATEEAEEEAPAEMIIAVVGQPRSSENLQQVCSYPHSDTMWISASEKPLAK